MGSKQLQDHLFQRIREQLPESASLADLVAEILFVSNDSAYRRIRGETPLLLEEAKLLCDSFSISLDGLLQSQPNSVSFLVTQINNGSYSFKKYLQEIHNNLAMVHAGQEKELIYLAKDMPIFYNFLYRPLFAFRYFFWMKSILQHPDFLHAQFSMDILPKDIEEIGKSINLVYNDIPSIEIWNTECVNSTISQIEYYREAGYFASEFDIETVYTAVRNLIEHIRHCAETGSKFLPGENPSAKRSNFLFFHNRIVLGDNTIVATVDGKKTVFISYDVLNYMVTRDENFCDDTRTKLHSLMKRATILSNASEKQRNIFFNIMARKIPSHSSALTRSSL